MSEGYYSGDGYTGDRFAHEEENKVSSLQDDIVQMIVCDIMDTDYLGDTWKEIDLDNRYIIIENWRQRIKSLIELKLKELFNE